MSEEISSRAAIARRAAEARMAATQRMRATSRQPVEATPDGRTVAPDTTREEAARIPEGMVYDPRTGGYHDAALFGEQASAGMGLAGNVLAGRIFQGEYTDEALGAADAAVSGRSPEIVQERARQTTQQFAEERPLAALGARVTGAIGSTVGAAAQVQKLAPSFVGWASGFIPASLTGQAATGVGAGAVAGGLEGVVAGYGAGRGDARGASAMEYGAIGTVAGAVGGVVAPIANKTAQALTRSWQRVRRSIPGLSPDATDEVVEAVGADIATGRAAENVRRAGDAAMVADAGQATADLLDTAVSMSQQGGAIAGERVMRRVNTSRARLNANFNEVMGGPQGIIALNEAVDNATKPGIRAAYSEAYNTPLQYGGSGAAKAAADKALSVFNKIPDRFKREALVMAREMMEIDGVPAQQLLKIDEAGNVTASRLPGVAEMDYVKRALNAIVEDNTDEFGKVNYKGRTAAIYARRLRDSVADAVPAYRAALEQASDQYALKGAIDIGARLLDTRTTREEVSRWAAQATQVEKRNAAAGLRAQIDELMANARPTRGNPSTDAAEVKKVLDTMRSSAAKQKMIALLGPKEARKVIRAIDEAARATELAGNVARNSRTAARAARNERISERQAYSPDQIGRDVASGELLGAGRKLTQTAAGNTPADRGARVEEMYVEIAEYLTGRRGQEALQAAEELVRRAQESPQAARELQKIGRSAAASIGLPAGQSYGQSQRTGPR